MSFFSMAAMTTAERVHADELAGGVRPGEGGGSVGWPRISIVTPSFNQGAFIERTIRSVLEQGYPNLEHIVVDGLSTDETPSILARYDHLTVIREADRGQADAINKGFLRARGEILAFLNADDTLEPGALVAVAQALDARAGRHVVIGRCRFIDETDRFLGIEHPSAYVNHARVLAIWLGHWLPQPAIFWSRAAWERSGPLDPENHLVPDYELFCRMSRNFAFHRIERVLANYRLHADSKTASMDDRTRLERSVAVSRRYWGPWWSPLRWRLALSLLRFRLDRVGRGRALLRGAVEDWRAGRRLRAALGAVAGTALAPGVAFYVGFYAPLRGRAAALVKTLIAPRLAAAAETGGAGTRAPSPQTLAYMSNTRAWSDGWVGPRLVLVEEPPIGAAALRLSGTASLSWFPGALHLAIRTDRGASITVPIDRDGPFMVDIPVPDAATGALVIEVTADRWYVPHWFHRNRDFRPLSWQFVSLMPVSAGVRG
jgi:glycosyltransferase involved in cell wall biosynthesis